MTRTNPDADALALSYLQDPSAVAMRGLMAMARELAKAWRARGRVARLALVLGYVAPLLLRKPADRPLPEGWALCLITNHLLSECDGVWWVPSEVVVHTASFTLARDVHSSEV